MGCCSSKPNTTSIAQNSRLEDERRFQNKAGSKLSEEISNKEGKEQPEEKLGFKKKELFVIQHRRSNDRRSDPKASSSESDGSIQPANTETPAIASNIMAMAANGSAVRTSSCTKEEVDAILIQCGRLSRSSSGSARKYSGSKRSHDFDRENEISTDLNCDNNGDIDDDERQTRRHSRGSLRRRTPSRSRERDPQSQRSGSRERAAASAGGSRRVSRSPGRRSKSPVTKSGNLGNSANNGITITSNSNGAIRPGKMISVPATVSIEKNNNNNGDCNVKRVLVKRNVGEGLAASRGGTPPRSRSPASRSNVVDASGGKEASFSRGNSRKVEHSPFRRTPLNEIDMGFLPFQPLADRANSVKGQYKCNEIEEVVDKQPLVTQDKLGIDVNYPKVAAHGAQACSSSRGPEVKEIAQINYCRVNENQQSIMNFDEDKREQLKANGSTQSGSDTTKFPLTLTRSRSSRRSRDLDINVEALLNTTPATNYNLLLLQDIQNFHQKTSASTSVSDTNPNANNSPIAKTPFSLPECLNKVSSIVEAVADLNSSTKPNKSNCARNDTGNLSYVTNSVDGKKRLEKPSIPFEEEDDDVTEPSMHKYVTVRKRGSGFESFQGGEFDELESSGSNSYTSGSRHQCLSSSSWEPNSVDSTDRWTSMSREGVNPVTLDTHAFSSNRGREL